MRKIFNCDNHSEWKSVSRLNSGEEYEKTISAAGCVFYFRRGEETFFLLSSYEKNFPLLEDFGGKCENKDTSPDATIIREVVEETNGIFNRDFVLSVLDKGKNYYSHKCKYFFKCIELDISGLVEDTSIFGESETFSSQKRNIKWCSGRGLMKDLAPRLKENLEFIHDFSID